MPAASSILHTGRSFGHQFLAAHKAQQHHKHRDSHQAHAEGLDGLGDVTVAPIHVDAVLVFGRKANQ